MCLRCVFIYWSTSPGVHNRWRPPAPPTVCTTLLRRCDVGRVVADPRPTSLRPLIHPPNAPFFRPSKLSRSKTGAIGRAGGLAEGIVGGWVGRGGCEGVRGLALNSQLTSIPCDPRQRRRLGVFCFRNLGGTPEPHLNKSRAS